MLLVRSGLRQASHRTQSPILRRIFPPISARYQIPKAQYLRYSSKMDDQTQWKNMISYWFDRNPQDWFNPPEGLDDDIRGRYQDLIVQARSGSLDHWAKDAMGALCLILLLDQFPRNIYRGSADSFSSDLQAQQVATRAIAQEFDKQLGQTSRFQQAVFYLPLMHAENLLSQVACVALYEKLLLECDKKSSERDFCQTGKEFAQRHLNCVAQLGRFPKRNAAIGRSGTEEEQQFLAQNPEGF